MHDTEGLNFKVVATGREEVDGRSPSNLRPLTLQKVYRWIDSMELEKDVSEAVKKVAGQYPNQALISFKRNFSTILAKIQRQVASRKKDAEEEIVEEL